MPLSTGPAASGSKPEKKTNKKVSRACNTCRLKRTKCDGQEPCFFCVDTHNECSYSREPRRRGPPSGYLRYIEARVAVLETFLGLLISDSNSTSSIPLTSTPSSASFSQTLTNLSIQLLNDSKPSSGTTQDVWDGYREYWAKEEACRVLEEAVVGFTGFIKRDEEPDAGSGGGGTASGSSSGFKPLLPLKGTDAGEGGFSGGKNAKKSPALTITQQQHPPSQTQVTPSTSRAYSPSSPSSPKTLYFNPPSLTSLVAPTESFERTTLRSSLSPTVPSDPHSSAHFRNADYHVPTYQHPPPPSFADGWVTSRHTHDSEHSSFMANFSFGDDNPPSGDSLRAAVSGPSELDIDAGGEVGGGGMDLEMDSDLPNVLPLGEDGSTAYTGSYWRTATALLDQQDSPTADPLMIPAGISSYISRAQTDERDSKMYIDLPPAHIMSHFLNIYYNQVHPTLPFLPGREALDSLALNTSTAMTEGNTALLLAICGYSGPLSPDGASAAPVSRNASSTGAYSGMDVTMGTRGSANKIAANFWYEQSRTLVMNRLRTGGSSLEGVQALLLCALRDQGQGWESQAWLLLGLAVRMCQDLGLHSNSTEAKGKGKGTYSAEELAMRRRVWGVTLILDILLSLQLGRPSAIVEGHVFSDGTSTTTSPALASIRTPILNPDTDTDHPLFSHTVSLSRIISHINLYLYLGFNGPTSMNTNTGGTSRKPSEMLTTLKANLDMWHQALPVQFRISIGHQPTREVIELNMLYHVAIILLYRPFYKDRPLQAAEVCLEAASTFNALLSKYRSSHSLPLCNPHLIYLIYTAAITHLSGYRQLEDVSTTTSLQTHLHLLNCQEALKVAGQTWVLAGRYGKSLDRLMYSEGMKPESGEEGGVGSMLGKRKRRDTSSLGGDQQQHQRRATSTTPQMLYNSSVQPHYSSPASSDGQGQNNLGSWPSSASMPSTTTASMATTTTSTSWTDPFFDPESFSSNTGWMPEFHAADSFDNVWNPSEWSDNFWAENFQMPSGISMGAMEGDFVTETGPGGTI